MEYFPLELTIISAKDLKDVNLFSKMKPYAVVCLSGDLYQIQEARTPVDRNGGTNPTWNFTMNFPIIESAARQNRLALQVVLRSARRVLGDKDVGVVHVPIKELLDDPGDGETAKIVNYPVRRHSGKLKGSVNFSYKFGEMVTAPEGLPEDEPVLMAHPSLVAGFGSVPPYGAAPGQIGTGHGYPPPTYQGGYPPAYGGYAPQQPGYGYPPKKNNFAMYLGAGLLGKAVEGLVIGAMEPDATGNDGGLEGFNGFF